ncbi:MAG: glycosyltransferase family 4 protein [Candidatus Omnitrophica bacterium]|nr:glycosyltransferase family 4 protein [Candidatus Omnitrophota bacterium]
MRIAINCRSFMGPRPVGIGRYAGSLVRQLALIDSRNEYFLYCPRGLFDLRRKFPQPPAANFFVKPDPFGWGVDFAAGHPDIYHAPSPEILRTKVGRVIVTVHDLVFKVYPQVHTAEALRLSEQLMDSIVGRADQFICISRSTAADLEKYYPSTRGKTVIVYNGIDSRIFYPISDDERSAGRDWLKKVGILPPFLLFVGTLEPRKNLKNIFQAFAAVKRQGYFSGQLVVAGMKGWMSEGLRDDLRRMGLEKDVVFLGFVSDENLRWLYNLTQVFLYPSFYEGFGYPVVEAMACGAAIVTSNVSSCAEIAATAALTVDPAIWEDMARAIRRILEDEEMTMSLRAAALRRAAEFSPGINAQRTLAVYAG